MVPEIDIPGHSQAAIAAYPELGNTDVIDTDRRCRVLTGWGVNPNVLAPTDATLRVLRGRPGRDAGVFPVRFVHLGGDECPKEQWQARRRAQARMRGAGAARTRTSCRAGSSGTSTAGWPRGGRRLIGWDEILEGRLLDAGLAPGAAVSSWRGYAGGIAAARAGHDVVMCPEQHVYLDHRQAAGPDEPIPIGYVRTLEDVHRFEPVPPAAGRDRPGEARASAPRRTCGPRPWTTVRAVDYLAFPRLAAFAEVVWSHLPAPAPRDHDGFTARMAAHYGGWTRSASSTARPAGRTRGSGGPGCSDVRSKGRPRTCDTCRIVRSPCRRR